MPFVFNILINEKFGEAYYQIPILMIATMFNILVSFLGSIYVAKKLTKEIAKTSIFAAIINLVVNISLVNFIGLYAASISTAVSYFAMFVYRIIDSRKYVKLSVPKKLVFSFIIVTAITVITYYVRNTALSVITLIMVVIYALLINKNSMQYIVKAVNKKMKK